MGILGKDGAFYNTVEELMQADARWEQQNKQNKLLEEQNRLMKQEMQQNEMQRQKELEMQMKIEREKIYEESKKTEAIEAQTRAIEEQNRIALMTDEEKAEYKEQKEKEEIITELNKRVNFYSETMEGVLSTLDNLNEQYLENFTLENNRYKNQLKIYQQVQDRNSNKKKAKLEKRIGQGVIILLCSALLITLGWLAITDEDFRMTAILFVIVMLAFMLGSVKWIDWYYSRDCSKKMEEVKKKIKTSIIPSLPPIPKFKEWTFNKATNDIDLYKRHILDYMITLENTLKQWEEICNNNKEIFGKVEDMLKEYFDEILEYFDEFISYLKE